MFRNGKLWLCQLQFWPHYKTRYFLEKASNQKILTNETIFTILINISPRRSFTLYDAEQNREAFFEKTDKGKFSVTEVIGKYPTHG